MLILVPWKPFVFVWGLPTAMLLLGYAEYCLEGRNPFSIDKYHLQRVHAHHTAGFGLPEHNRTETIIRRHNPRTIRLASGCDAPSLDGA